LWTCPEVAQSFKDALGKEQMGELYRFIVRANGLVKYGKAQPLDAEVKTPSGPIRMGDVEVGAVVCGIDGPTTVTGVFPQGEMDVYRLTFCDGSSTEASNEHLWNVEILGAGSKTLTTAEIMALPAYRIAKRQVAIPLGRAHFDASDVPLDPYFMGVLLGDGSFRGNMVRLSSPDKDIIERVRATLPEGYAIDSPPSWAAIDHAITAPNRSEGRRHKVKAALKDMGLWGHTSLDKFIPAQYLRNTVEVRMEVARGLLDTDGWVDLLGQPHFGTSSRRLAEDFRELAESLGASVMWNEKESASGNTAYDLGVRVEDARAWFWLSRKAQKATPRKKPAKRTITSIEYVGKKQCQCIMVDDPRHLYLTDRFIVTHNTVLSPTTAMRNWQSAMFFALANGHFDLTQMKKSVAAFREQVRQNATDGDLAYLRHLKELGVVYDTPYAGEMMRFIEDAKADSGVDTVMRVFGASDGAIAKGLRGVKQINQVAQGFYSFGDDFWKIIGFENEKAGLLKAGLPVAEAEREAAKRIRDTYPTYSMVGAGIQKLSRFPLMGTFVSFPAEIVRTSANMLRTTAADLKSDNPALRALGMKRAVGMAVVSGLFYGLAALSKAGSGVDDDEEEALRDLAPEWQKNSTFLFAGRDEKGQLRYFDMSFLDPYGYWKRPITAMLRDQPWEKSAASAIKDMLTPFFGADIATAAIFQVLANKKDSGGKVYQEGADALDQTGAIANHLRKALQPGFVGNIERLTLAAQGVRREGSGQPYDLNDEMTALLGWRASTMDPKTALYYRSFEFNDAMSEAKQVLTRTLRSVNPVSPEDIRDAREVAQSRQAEAFTEMRRLVLAAQAAGMNPAQIRQVLKQSSISQANAEALMRGTPPRLVLGVPAAAKAVQQARAMEGPEFAQEVARRYRMASGM
ncbi:MAG: hypothetical protein LCH90_21020, partial [Proteobacteria bacterium]|nr:hypothetical protein [Pseudomonadota bacterium]